MFIRKKRFEISLPSDHTHWCLQLSQPSDGWDGWDEQRVKLWFGFYKLFISVSLWKADTYKTFEGNGWRWGVSWMDAAVILYYGRNYSVVNMPWSWKIVRWDLLCPDGSLYLHNGYPVRIGLRARNRSLGWYDVRATTTDDQWNALHTTAELMHTKRDGTVQHATITLQGEEREWRWKWFRWLPFPRKVQRSVNCSSNTELGEKSGSWKGGLMGWSCEWKRGETMEQAFRRWHSNWNGV